MLPSSAQFQSLSLAVGQFCKLSCLSTVCKLYLPELELELELELILTKILELELELNPKTVAGIGINSIFFGMTKGRSSTARQCHRHRRSQYTVIGTWSKNRLQNIAFFSTFQGLFT